MSESTSRDVRARVVRRILIFTVGIEAVILGGYAVMLGIDSMTQKGTEAGAGVALAVSAAAICAGLLLVVRATLRARRGARAPIIVWQIMQAAVAKEALASGSAGGVAWGAVLLVLAAVAVAGAVWPGVLRDEVPAA